MNKPQRLAGVLLHITSLPGAGYNGEFGQDAYQFVDFLESCGIKLWQVLPLGPTMSDKSPYQSTSAHAGSAELISIDELNKHNWFVKDETHNFIVAARGEQSVHTDEKPGWLKFAHYQFGLNANDAEIAEFNEFTSSQKYWLDEYALYAALKDNFKNKSWVDWPVELRNRDDAALKDARETFAGEIDVIKFIQFIFHQQWSHLKQYANSKNIKMFGDLPLFVSHDSADVWANKELFKLDGEGHLLYVAGVPPDYFAATGQRWGNPVYDWISHEVDSFKWWIERLEHQFDLFDYVRIDHFRGLESYWEIPADHETALHGNWVSAPGGKMLAAVEHHFGRKLPLIAEDLGSITEEVLALKHEFKLPGMKILQFAFGGGSDNPYLPHNHEMDSVIYTGTHDNNTTLGWVNELPDHVKTHIHEYYGQNDEGILELLMRSAYASVATMAIFPLQDLMGLDESARMNIPGTGEGNWLWRFEWENLDKPVIAEYMNKLNTLYNR